MPKIFREKITFTCHNLTLEGCLETPASPGLFPGVVFCHPHPLYGGDMDNYVLRVLKRELNQRGMVTLRFNFRGVVNSQGSFDEGTGEKEDALAAVSFLAQSKKVDRERLAIAGYSFGGMIALSAGKQDRLTKAVAAVSPVMTPGLLQDNDKPTFLLCGERDEMTPPSSIKGESLKTGRNYDIKIIRGADHFWMGHEKELTENIASFLQKYI